MDLVAHESIMREMRQAWPLSVTDGPVMPERYSVADPRIAWVLREVNNEGATEAWDLRTFLREEEQLFSYSRWSSTYGAVAKISKGLLLGLDTAKVGSLDARNAASCLKDVAVVNVNKLGGRRQIEYGALASGATMFQHIVERQLQAIDADLLILAGSVDLAPPVIRRAFETANPPFAARMGDTWLVRTYHPGQRRIKCSALFQGILDALSAAGWKSNVAT